MENFKEVITQWTQNELEIEKLQNQLKQLRLKNKERSIDLLNHIHEHKLTDNLFTISSLQKKICVRESKTAEHLSFKFLQACLESYFQENPCKNDEYHLQNLIQYIKSKRSTSIKENLEMV